MSSKYFKYDIVLVDLEPTIWNEQSWIRPCLIMQNDEFFQYQGTTIILPITTKINKDSNFWVLLNDYKKYWLDKESFIISFQLRTISNKRIIKKIWNITDLKIREKINNTIKLTLDLDDDFLIKNLCDLKW